MKTLNCLQMKSTLESIFGSQLELDEYNGYVCFISEPTQNDDRYVAIHFPELQSFDNEFVLEDACFVLTDIDADPIDNLKY